MTNPSFDDLRETVEDVLAEMRRGNGDGWTLKSHSEACRCPICVRIDEFAARLEVAHAREMAEHEARLDMNSEVRVGMAGDIAARDERIRELEEGKKGGGFLKCLCGSEWWMCATCSEQVKIGRPRWIEPSTLLSLAEEMEAVLKNDYLDLHDCPDLGKWAETLRTLVEPAEEEKE